MNTSAAFLTRLRGVPLPADFSRDLSAGFITASVAIAYYVSAAALLFAGPLAPHVGVALGAALFGGAVLAAVNAWRGSIALSSAGAEPVTVPVLAGVTAAIAAGASADAALPTAYAAVVLSALLIGLMWWGMGVKRLGRWIRLIPYPVIGGFLASVGWLLVTGSTSLLEGRAMDWQAMHRLVLAGPSPLTWAGFASAGLIWLLAARMRSPWSLPLSLSAIALVMHGAFMSLGLSPTAAREAGWLLHIASAWPQLPFDATLWAAVDWPLLMAQAGTIVAAALVSVLGLLLSDTSLEVAFDAEADLDGDLRSLGLANIGAAFGGGLTGGVSVSRSLLNRQAGAVSRRSGFVQAGICLIVMAGGAPLVTLIPVPALGGLLLFMGLALLKTWVVDGWYKLSRNDYCVMLAIVGTTMTLDFLTALFVGTLIACVDFAMAAGRIGAFRHVLPGTAWRSRIERSAGERAVLDACAERLTVLELRGFLFFGSITEVGERLQTLRRGLASHVVLDFRGAHAMDSSAAQALARTVKQLRMTGTTVAFSSLRDSLRTALQRNGCDFSQLNEHRDLDHAIEAWEAVCLGQAQAETADDALQRWLISRLGNTARVERLRQLARCVTLEPGELLFKEGATSDSLFFLERGRISAWRGSPQAPLRIRCTAAPNSIGETGWYRQQARTATARADEKTVLWKLDQAAWARMQQEDSDLALALHGMMARLLAERLQAADNQVLALQS